MDSYSWSRAYVCGPTSKMHIYSYTLRESIKNGTVRITFELARRFYLFSFVLLFFFCFKYKLTIEPNVKFTCGVFVCNCVCLKAKSHLHHTSTTFIASLHIHTRTALNYKIHSANTKSTRKIHRNTYKYGRKGEKYFANANFVMRCGGIFSICLFFCVSVCSSVLSCCRQ